MSSFGPFVQPSDVGLEVVKPIVDGLGASVAGKEHFVLMFIELLQEAFEVMIDARPQSFDFVADVALEFVKLGLAHEGLIRCFSSEEFYAETDQAKQGSERKNHLAGK